MWKGVFFDRFQDAELCPLTGNVPGQTLAASKGQFSSSSNHLPFSPVFLTFLYILISRLFFSIPHYLRTFSEIMRSKKIGRDFSFLLLSSRNDLIWDDWKSKEFAMKWWEMIGNYGKGMGKDRGVMGYSQAVTRSILGLLVSQRGVEQKIFEVKRSLMGKEKDPAKYRWRYFTRS